MTHLPFDDADVDGHLTAQVRAFVAKELVALDLEDLTDEAVLVSGELATNAVLHGGGLVCVEVEPIAGGVRIEVHDRTRVPPVRALVNTETMTGRGLRLVDSLAARWGVQPTEGGKAVWAELVRGHVPRAMADDLLDTWDDDWNEPDASVVPRHRVSLGEIPTDLLLAAKSHVDNLVREFTLAAGGALSGTTGAVPPHLAALIDAVATRFAEPRLAIKHQALAAARRGLPRARVELYLPASAADAAEEYLRALDEADAYCRAARLLTLETPPQHRVFRQWYVGELVRQLRAAAAGLPPPSSESFEQRLLREIDAVAKAQRAIEQTARLNEVSAALVRAATPEAVATAVLEQGVAALQASGGGLLLATASDRLAVPATVGYGEELVAHLRAESQDAELPAAEALRTGEPVWLESRDERDRRFPQLRNLERETVSLCAVPLTIGDRRIGALRFSFREPRLFDEEERRFVLALAAQTAQALDRAQLYRQRSDLSQRLQRSLLPGRLPEVPGAEIAAVYHPLGEGIDLGGDFYDVWAVGDGRWAFVIGDAAGTGPEAAALTAMVRFTLRALTVTHTDPLDVLDKLNAALLDAGASGPDEERFCTALLGLLTPGPRLEIELAGGGHPHPLWRRGDGPAEEVRVGGSLLGVLDTAVPAHTRVVLDPGDVLVLYTDGAVETRRGGTMFGSEGVRAAVESAGPDARSVVETVERAVLHFSDHGMDDDLAVLAIRATG